MRYPGLDYLVGLMSKQAQDVVLATTNPLKLVDLKNGANWPEGINWKTLADFPNIQEAPDEIGTSALENALAKAKFYNKQLNMPVISNDMSLFIDGIDYEPGTKPKRFHPGNAAEKLQHFFKLMNGNPNRKGRSEFADIYYDHPKNAPLVAHESFEVNVPLKPRGEKDLEGGQYGFWSDYATEIGGRTPRELRIEDPDKVPSRVVAQILADKIRARLAGI